MFVAGLWLLGNPAVAAELKPYTATYATHLYGLTLTMRRTLRRLDHGVWELHNHSSLLFEDVDSTARFYVAHSVIQPLSFDYQNDFNKKRNSQLRFNLRDHTVVDQHLGNPPLHLGQPAWDTLSFQAQLRLDLMNGESSFTRKIYPQVIRDHLKNYIVTKLGEETLHTQLGTFATVKLEQRQPGDDEHTVIWLAKDREFLILRLQRIEKGDVKYQIDLKQATLDGKTLPAR